MTLLPHADPAGIKEVPIMGRRVLDDTMSSTDPPTRPHAIPWLRLDMVDSGPSSARISRRWRQCETPSILEILDAAIEIVGENGQHNNDTTSNHKRLHQSKSRD